MVVAGNWSRGLAGDSAVYPPGSSVSNPPFSVAFGLHCNCLLWLSVFDNESGLREVSTHFCNPEGFYGSFRLMARSFALSLLGHSVAMLRKSSGFSFAWPLVVLYPAICLHSKCNNLGFGAVAYQWFEDRCFFALFARLLSLST